MSQCMPDIKVERQILNKVLLNYYTKKHSEEDKVNYRSLHVYVSTKDTYESMFYMHKEDVTESINPACTKTVLLSSLICYLLGLGDDIFDTDSNSVAVVDRQIFYTATATDGLHDRTFKHSVKYTELAAFIQESLESELHKNHGHMHNILDFAAKASGSHDTESKPQASNSDKLSTKEAVLRWQKKFANYVERSGQVDTTAHVMVAILSDLVKTSGYKVNLKGVTRSISKESMKVVLRELRPSGMSILDVDKRLQTVQKSLTDDAFILRVRYISSATGLLTIEVFHGFFCKRQGKETVLNVSGVYIYTEEAAADTEEDTEEGHWQ